MTPRPAWPVEWRRGVPEFVGGLAARTPCAGSAIHDGEDPEQDRQACAMCAPCPARQACAEWALDHPAEAGRAIWGGLTREDRQATLRRRPRR